MSVASSVHSVRPMPVPGALTLACLNCNTQENLKLSAHDHAELRARQQLLRICATCGISTLWCEVQEQKAEVSPAYRRVHLELPIRVQSEDSPLRLEEISTTIDASRKGASFLTNRPFREGMIVSVQMPYSPEDRLPGTRARVTTVEEHGAGREVSVSFLN